MKTYRLTSPPMRGEPVTALQRRLAGRNVFKENYKPGVADGQFGENTAGACYRAKFALGYASKDLVRSYGGLLESYLSGKKKLPKAYRDRRAARKRAAARVPKRVKALREAKKHVGVKESPPGSNRCRFSTWYGLTGPWCAMFVTWCYTQAGSKAFAKSSRYAYVPYIVSAARLGGRGLAIVHDPQPGDVVCFDWQRDRIADHVGLFDGWTNRASGTFKCLEGNTGIGNDSNGGEVMRRDRNRSQVQAFVRVVK